MRISKKDVLNFIKDFLKVCREIEKFDASPEYYTTHENVNK